MKAPTSAELIRLTQFLAPHAGVQRADKRKKLDRLRRYISRPAVSEKRQSLKVRYAHDAAGGQVLVEG